MESTATDFEQLPATKRDLADVAVQLVKEIEKGKEELREEIEKGKEELREEIEKGKEELRSEIKDGFEHMEELLSAPNTGLLPRVKRIEEVVGIRSGQ